MFSAIAAFFWGASTAGTPSLAPEPGHEEPLPSEVSPMKDDVFSDAMTHEGVDEVTPAAVESILSTSSLSDEEAGWVFVNNKKKASMVSVLPEENQAVEPIEVDPVLEEEEVKSPPVKNNKNHNNNNNSPTTRSRNIPNSALHASSVLSALEELRPQQKSQRRQKERHLKRKQLERANKASQVESSSNQPAKRRAMYNSAVFSRAVNNRKC